jgi:hypothetical protein
MKTITIVVDKTGQVSMQTHGYEGLTCRDATKALERALGIVLSDRPTFDQATHQSVVEAQ